MKLISILIVIFVPFANAIAQDILIFGGSEHKDFLGCLSCNEYSSDSVWNDMSTFGWRNGLGKWNSFGPYVNSFSGQSACNQFASDPPVLVDRQGNIYGRLSVNEYISGSICGVSGNENVCTALKVLCSGH